MPELPEVETIRRQMDKELRGAKILAADVRFGKRLNVAPKEFAKIVAGAAIRRIGRRAKLLLVELSNGWTIVTHLKMTGRFLLQSAGTPPGKHDHIVFMLSKVKGQKSKVKCQLVFQDTRKFGFLKLFKTADLEEKVFAKEGYGPEPLDPSFTFRKFKMCVTARPGKKIKPLLMDQTCIAGIGNIYADEACWYAKVRPERRVGALTEAELRGVYRGALKSMRESIRYRGTSADEYLDLYGKEGEYVPRLKVSGREGEPCRRRDGGRVRKIWINGRGAHFCPKCQK